MTTVRIALFLSVLCCSSAWIPTAVGQEDIDREILVGSYGPVGGFDARQHFAQVYLDLENCYLHDTWHGKDGISTYVAFRGPYRVEGNTLFLDLKSREEMSDDWSSPGLTHNRVEIESTVKATVEVKEDLVLLTFEAFDRAISLRKHRRLPDPLYETVAGRYSLKSDVSDDLDGGTGDATEIALSSGDGTMMGDYGDYFVYSQSYSGECGMGQYDTYNETSGNYEIKDGKLLLHATMTRGGTFMTKKSHEIHEPRTIELEIVVGMKKVTLIMPAGNGKIEFVKVLK